MSGREITSLDRFITARAPALVGVNGDSIQLRALAGTS